MSGSLLEVLTENEYRANRSSVLAGLWTAAEDPEFAALVERNPAAAVREVEV